MLDLVSAPKQPPSTAMAFIDTPPGGHDAAQTNAAAKHDAGKLDVCASDFTRCWWATPAFMLQVRVYLFRVTCKGEVVVCESRVRVRCRIMGRMEVENEEYYFDFELDWMSGQHACLLR